MSLDLNRRQLLLAGGAARLGAGTLARAMAPQPKGATKKVLFFTKSSGFQHSVIARHGDKPAHAEKILTDIGKDAGFEVVASKDGRLFEPDQIGQWDVFAFQTTGDLSAPGTDKSPPLSAEGEKALYDAVRAGKGFMGMHCATDTFGKHRNKGADDPYIQMIGGEFNGHGAQQSCRIEIADSEFPGVGTGFGKDGKSFEITDEWYRAAILARRYARHHGSSHRRDEGRHVPAAQLSDDLGPRTMVKDVFSTPRWGTARMSGRTRCTRRCCWVLSPGRRAASKLISSPISPRLRPREMSCKTQIELAQSRTNSPWRSRYQLHSTQMPK